MAHYHLLNVFTDAGGAHGNPLAVFLDGASFTDDERRRIAADLGYAETVFVEVPTWDDGELRWIRARAEWGPEMALREYASVAEVDALGGAPGGLGFVDCWAWDDEEAGLVRSRVFAPGVGIAEDEATGAAALRLGAQIGRPIVIRQGRGSVIHATPDGDGVVDVGGRVAYVDEVPYG